MMTTAVRVTEGDVRPVTHMPTQTAGTVTPMTVSSPAGSSRPRRYPGDGRARQASARTIGYSKMPLNATGATSVLNTPPSIPPKDIHT